MYKTLPKLLLIAALFATNAHAQLVVATPDSDLIAIENQVANVATWGSQLAQLKSQLQQAQQLYSQLNGLRNISQLLANPLLAQYLPPNYAQALTQLKSGQGGVLAGISGTLNQIAAQNQAASCSASGAAPSVQAICKAKWQQLSMNQYVGQQGYQQAAQNITNMQAFLTAIQTTPDPKAMQDLHARIALEQVKMNNEMVKLQTIKMMNDAQEEMRKQNESGNTVNMLQPQGSVQF